MTVYQLPAEVGVFARYLRELTARLDPGGGWYEIFCQRDPDGMRACLEGTEIPPWDVVESLLQDLAVSRGQEFEFAEPESVRARQLHAAAAATHDRQPGARDALGERLELMRREQVYASGRAEEMARRLSAEPEGTSAAAELAHELAWTRDDQARASARVAELRARLGALDEAARGRAWPTEAQEGLMEPEDWSGFASRQSGGRPGPATGGADAGWPGGEETPAARDGSFGGGAPHEGTGWSGAAEVPAARDGSSGPGQSHDGTGWSSAGRGASAAWDGSFGPGPSHEGTGWSGAQEASAARDGASRPDAAPAYDPRRHPAVGADARSPQGQDAPAPAPTPLPTPAPRPAKAKKSRRPRGARFAGVEGGGVEAAAVPLLPVLGDVPRGARYGGAAPGHDNQAGPEASPAPTAATAEDERAERAARETVGALGRLRAEGRSGEAHAVLCEAAARPAPWLPVLAAELHRAGLDADWVTLLWEAASQPALKLAAAAGALAAAGRTEDSRQLLRQGVTRPADDIAAAVLALEDEHRSPEARALLDAFVQVHAPEDAARIAERDPRRLVPQLLAAARGVSAHHERDLVHALRVAGHLHG
ncbi:hypothetical protein ACIHCQ_26450 [Streptomyces sp. NPDC052236]|uniref:hypothetical protein n=1 Tax=Streptomyces sp. NPDC052236 TaxID=3365686 RepID=UPI0037CF7377